MDGLDDFEKSLAAEKANRERDEERRERKHRHHDRHDRDRERDREHRHRSHRHEEDRDRRKHRGEEDRDGHGRRRHRRDDEHGDEHRSKRSRRDDDERHEHKRRNRDERRSEKTRDPQEDLPAPDEEKAPTENDVDTSKPPIERDSWMMAPSAMDVDYVQRAKEKMPPPSPPKPEIRKVHARELNAATLHSLNAGEDTAVVGQREVDYKFGDRGSGWRMSKLQQVFSAVEETGRDVNEVAMEKYGSMEDFDDAREEKEELERRRVYGTGYEMKEKPSGELHQERLRNIRQNGPPLDKVEETEQGTVIPDETPAAAQAMDQTQLNRLRAQMMKAKMRRAPNAAQLEDEYNRAAAAFSSNRPPDSVVIGAMENRQLAGTRGEVTAVTNKRGLERGTVKENEDMTVEDMVREERRTKGVAGGEALRQAERIAKDGKFTDDLDYLDDNAAKLAKRVHKSEINLKNTAVADYQKLNRALENCPLCHHDETGRPPVAPVVALGMKTFLTLPTEPEISTGGAMIVPLTHRKNLLECDDDEWEEIRNFMKSLTRMYHAQGRDVVFYENAANPQQLRHAAMAAAAIPYEDGAMAPQYFKEAFLSSDAEWSQHRPIIDTQKAANEGMGRRAFRNSIAKEMPYFHAWFSIDGGLGHIVEDAGRWPKGDIFAREVIGGIVDAEPHIIKKQGKWSRGGDAKRVEAFKKDWRKYDWTRMLEGQQS